MSNFFILFLIIFLLTLLIGIILSLASRFLAVKKDVRVEQITRYLPNANCGACGYPGCANYAENIVEKGADLNLCKACSQENFKHILTILGIDSEVKANERKVAFVRCQGDLNRTTKLFSYEGIEDCHGKALLLGGDKSCIYGCLGGGSCVIVCPVGAIKIDQALAKVDPALCIGCGVCLKECPTNVISLIPQNAKIAIACNSKDKGGVVRKYCKVGCIGCSLCVKKGEEGVFVVQDFLASVNYEQDSTRHKEGEVSETIEKAIPVCPSKVIVNLK